MCDVSVYAAFNKANDGQTEMGKTLSSVSLLKIVSEKLPPPPPPPTTTTATTSTTTTTTTTATTATFIREGHTWSPYSTTNIEPR